jgi:hypothetical protein
MKDDARTVVERVRFEEGLRVDVDEGWRKIISRQFGGPPGRAFNELIQNFIDSHDAGTPWEDRLGSIDSGPDWIGITDYGGGMDRRKLVLLATLGGTDKEGDDSKIGRFGIGFFSIFNPKLGTRRVVVTTRCEGAWVEVAFEVKTPERRPDMTCRVVDGQRPFSTEVKAYFSDGDPVRECLKAAENCLTYFPCRVKINGRPFDSMWAEAGRREARFFEDGSCDGFVEGAVGGSVTLLCKYEYIMSAYLPFLLTGGHGMRHDIRDYAEKACPFVPRRGMLINSNALRVTISRDSFYMDSAYDALIRSVVSVLHAELDQALRENELQDTAIIANQYILRAALKLRLWSRADNGSPVPASVCDRLLDARVYPVARRKRSMSLREIAREKGDFPVYHTRSLGRTEWMGGRFAHRFVLVVPDSPAAEGAPRLCSEIFKTLFDDEVDLDTITADREKLLLLVDRGIIDPRNLAPATHVFGPQQLTAGENALLRRVNALLCRREVLGVLEKRLFMSIKGIEARFFSLQEGGNVVVTGLLDELGNPLNSEVPDNLKGVRGSRRDLGKRAPRTLILGIGKDHPAIRMIMENGDRYMEFYLLSYLAHQLALCQKLLSPCSDFFAEVEEELIHDLRKVFLEILSERAAEEPREKVPAG